MRKTKIIKVTPGADVGLSKLGKDVRTLYHWGAKKYTKKALGSEKRPKGVPKTKKYDGYIYKFYGIFNSNLDAREMANMIRYHGSYARVQQHGSKWIVWQGDKY